MTVSDWISQDYFWFAVAMPTAITLWAVISTWPRFRSALGPWACSVGLTTVLVVPPVQSYLHLLGQHPLNIYAMPVFVVVYLVWGQYELPSVRIAYAGTFSSLLLANFVGAWFLSQRTAPSDQPFFLFVGGTGIFDGLVLIPTGAALVIAATKLLLRRGHRVSFLLGRKQFLSQKARQL